VNVAAVLRSAIETSQPGIDAAGHRLTVTLPPDPLVVDGDAVRLAQVFANLLNNAARHTETPGDIWLDARREADDVVVSVRDAGVGISADMLPRVFEMFAQANGSHRRTQAGLGIGLSLVRSLVQMHGGVVTAASEGPGRGSEFTVRLPTTDAASKTEAPLRLPEPVPGVRVLVVDDNADAADSLGLLLGLLGADVRVTHDGASALETLTPFTPEMILLDIGMPGLDGYEVAARIRADPEHRGVTLVALTGWGQEDDRRRSHEAGFDYHLIKPTDLDALRALIISVATRSRPDTARDSTRRRT
jgi:CheY-like chemotaxis protein